LLPAEAEAGELEVFGGNAGLSPDFSLGFCFLPFLSPLSFLFTLILL
jgi:hypothetical protein